MTRLLFVLFLVLSLLLTGCIGLGYKVGAKSLFGQDIQTVYVPIFQADSFNRDIAERLTEAVCKRIESRSSYKVVSRPTADSVLEGQIVNRSKSVTIVNNYSDPREIQGTLNIQIRWRDRRNNDLRQFDAIPWHDGSGRASATGYLVAEYGQSELTMEQQQIDAIADQIVGMMETPW
ncbi:MAG: LPS assembly lipoprotein LptE [Planctomycetaceae bacterium]|nr:LPS assembly lipoprotein LptE [Planctomycetaceae bacterium]